MKKNQKNQNKGGCNCSTSGQKILLGGKTKKTNKTKKTKKTKKCGCLKFSFNKFGIAKTFKLKGGSHGQIPNYALNTYNTDPNYAQIASRNVPNQTGGFPFQSFLSSAGVIDAQQSANLALVKPQQVDPAPYIQPNISKVYSV